MSDDELMQSVGSDAMLLDIIELSAIIELCIDDQVAQSIDDDIVISLDIMFELED